ncbi:MAG: hypothetical protein EBR67_06040 [Proteobacteria bacterium]|nr:hypothetical protein [Pseudomonadota bacterium]
MIFNPIDYTALDFNKTPVTASITKNASSSLGITPADRAEDVFSSVNPYTAYSFNNSVSLKSWTADDSANAWAGLGAEEPLRFGVDGNIKFNLSEKPLNVYEEANKQNAETEKRIAELNAKQQEANAKNIQSMLAMFAQIIQLGAKAFSGSGTA